MPFVSWKIWQVLNIPSKKWPKTLKSFPHLVTLGTPKPPQIWIQVTEKIDLKNTQEKYERSDKAKDRSSEWKKSRRNISRYSNSDMFLNHQNKNLNFRRIRTLIVRVEGEHADHYTNKTIWILLICFTISFHFRSRS